MWVWMFVAEIARSLRLYKPTPREIDKTVGTTFIHSCAFLQLLTGASLVVCCVSKEGTRTVARIVHLTAFPAQVSGSSKGRMKDTCESCILCFVVHAQHDLLWTPSCSIFRYPWSLPTLLRHSQKKRILHRKNAAQNF